MLDPREDRLSCILTCGQSVPTVGFQVIKKFVPDGGQGCDRSGRIIDFAGMKKMLINETLELDLPQFPLDDLIHKLGGAKKVILSFLVSFIMSFQGREY